MYLPEEDWANYSPVKTGGIAYNEEKKKKE